MLEKIVPEEDLNSIYESYQRLKPTENAVDFTINLIKAFQKSSGEFKRYVDGETHLSLRRAGFEEPYSQWGERYGLTPEGYSAIRKATIELFVRKMIEAKGTWGGMPNKYDYMVSLAPK